MLTPSKPQLTSQKGCDVNQISRNDAIYKLCKKKLSSLDTESRESYILDWWGIDEDDVEFSSLSAELQRQMLANEDPPNDSENYKYDELIIIALSAEFKGVTNAFLAENMITMGVGTYKVCGELEPLEICPCCEYRTLNSRGDYEICRLCNWEDNGADQLEQYSGPNHMTLGEAKKQFSENMGSLPLGKWMNA